MSDDVADAREALANLRAARETCCRAVTYSALRAAAISLETAALDAEEAFAALLARLDAVAPLAAAAEHYRAAVAAEVEAKLRFDAERDGRGDHDAIDKARWRWVDATHAALAAQAELAKVAWDDDTRAALAARAALAKVAGGER